LDSLVGFFIDTDLEELRKSQFGDKVVTLLAEKYTQNYPFISDPLSGFNLWSLGVENQRIRTLNYFIRDSSLVFENKDSLKTKIH
jgi:hypothetical protein